MQITEPKKVPETCLAACLRDISALRGSLCFPLSRSSIRRAANSRPYDADRSVCARRGRRLGGPSLASPFGGLTVPRRRWRIQGRCEFKQPRRWRAVAKQARDRQCGKAARVPGAPAPGGEGARIKKERRIGTSVRIRRSFHFTVNLPAGRVRTRPCGEERTVLPGGDDILSVPRHTRL